MTGRVPTGSIHFSIALVIGSMRVPQPATGIIALVTFIHPSVAQGLVRRKYRQMPYEVISTAKPVAMNTVGMVCEAATATLC